MSRCFPYPPLGNAPSRASKYALIESIKFQNECGKTMGQMEKSKEQKKEKRREEKKREKKEKRKDKTHRNTDKSLFDQAHFGEKHWSGIKAELLSKKSKPEPEQLERSGVTEEHCEPGCLVAPSTSSDSTENSNKRKRYSLPVDVNRGHGKIIRLRIPLKSRIEEQHCAISGSINIPSQNENALCSSSGNDRDEIFSTSQPIEISEIPKSLMIEMVMTPMQKTELQYTNLMDSLVMPQARNDGDDHDWLLNGKNKETCAAKKLVFGNDGMACSLNRQLWPRAQYMQHVDLYALPFTIPF